MGKSGAGKSSMRTIVFSNYVARDVRRLGATIDVEHSNIRFLGNLFLNLWDCGGQDGFMENYLTPSSAGGQRESVFANVAVLIFVFDIESREFVADVANFEAVIGALGDCSGVPGASSTRLHKMSKDREAGKDAREPPKVFVLVHKMDLVQPGQRERLFAERSQHIRSRAAAFAPTVTFFATSIWDQSLYRAWTAIIHTLVPNASAIEALLHKLATSIGARELILYERTTCLVVTAATMGTEQYNPFLDRSERLSSILKTHKQSLARHTRSQPGAAHFRDFELRTSRFAWFVTRLTENTNLAVVLPPGEQLFNFAKAGVDAARARFVELDVGGGGREVKGEGRVVPERFLAGAARDVRSPVSEVPERGRVAGARSAETEGEAFMT